MHTDPIKHLRTQRFLFLAAVICMAAAMGVHESVFNNYLADTFDINAKTRGFLEFPRELPGFLVVAMTGMLAALPVVRLGVVGAMGFVAGMIGLICIGSQFGAMVVFMMIASAGHHLLQPVETSIVLSLGDPARRGRRMGIMRGLYSLGTIGGCAIIWVLFKKRRPLQTGLRSGRRRSRRRGSAVRIHARPGPAPEAQAIHFRAEVFALLYSGIPVRRPQADLLTFGMWVLVRIYDMNASNIARLLLIASVAGIVVKPLMGMAIDRLGERTILMADGLLLAVVCLGYGYAAKVFEPATAVLVAQICFVCDNLLFACGYARSTYVAGIDADPGRISSTLAMGVSINHISGMVVPALAGVVWVAFGYERVFLLAAVLALVIMSCAWRVGPKRCHASAASTSS